MSIEELCVAESTFSKKVNTSVEWTMSFGHTQFIFSTLHGLHLVYSTLHPNAMLLYGSLIYNIRKKTINNP